MFTLLEKSLFQLAFQVFPSSFSSKNIFMCYSSYGYSLASLNGARPLNKNMSLRKQKH